MGDAENIKRVKEAHEMQLLSLPGVVAVDIGPKFVDGKETNIQAIRVYVSKKKPENTLPAEQTIPRTLEGVPVDVIERRFVLH